MTRIIICHAALILGADYADCADLFFHPECSIIKERSNYNSSPKLGAIASWHSNRGAFWRRRPVRVSLATEESVKNASIMIV